MKRSLSAPELDTEASLPISGSSDDVAAPFAAQTRIVDKASLEYVYKSGFAGGIAGCAAKTLIAPLDRVKILFQTSNPDFRKYSGSFTGLFRAGDRIYSSEGLRGLFQGHSATLLRIFPYAAIKFVMYEQIRSLLIRTEAEETGIRRLVAGSLSGITSVFCTYPLDLIRVRLAFETPSNFKLISSGQIPHGSHTHRGGRLVQTCIDILTEPPAPAVGITRYIPKPLHYILNFYRGFTPTILGMIPYAGVSFWTHDILHDVFRSRLLAPMCVVPADAAHLAELATRGTNSPLSHDHRQPLKAWAQLIAGGFAGMLSQTAAYPLEVVRRRMQVGGVTNRGEFLSIAQTARLIYAERGVRGFYVGLTIGYIKVIPMAACSFYVYEQMKLLLGI